MRALIALGSMLLLSACGGGSPDTGDFTPPNPPVQEFKVVKSSPEQGSSGNAVTTMVTLEFNSPPQNIRTGSPKNPDGTDPNSITFYDDLGNPVPLNRTLSGNSLLLVPAVSLTDGMWYTVTATTDLADAGGNRLKENFVLRFQVMTIPPAPGNFQWTIRTLLVFMSDTGGRADLATDLFTQAKAAGLVLKQNGTFSMTPAPPTGISLHPQTGELRVEAGTPPVQMNNVVFSYNE